MEDDDASADDIKKVHDAFRSTYKLASLNDSVEIDTDQQSNKAALLDKQHTDFIRRRCAMLLANRRGVKWPHLERNAESWLRGIQCYTVRAIDSTLSLESVSVSACLSSAYCAKPTEKIAQLKLYREHGSVCVVDVAEQLAKALLNTTATRSSPHIELVNHINVILSTVDLSRLALRGYNVPSAHRRPAHTSCSTGGSPCTQTADNRSPSAIFNDFSHITLTALSQLYSTTVDTHLAADEEMEEFDDSCSKGLLLDELAHHHSYHRITVRVRSGKDATGEQEKK